jgi:hypothetical protein
VTRKGQLVEPGGGELLEILHMWLANLKIIEEMINKAESNFLFCLCVQDGGI